MSPLLEILNRLNIDPTIINNTLLIEQYPLSFEQFSIIQKLATEHVQASNQAVYIITNHSTLLTQGRGDRQNQTLGNSSIYPSNIPLYDIKRGGGVTMHHEKQWIFYPIVKLHPERWSLIHHLSWLLEVTRESIENEFNVTGLKSIRNPLGLWWGDQKIASVGVGVEKFITQHGIAVNVGEQPLAIDEWSKLNPCGLNSNSYSCLNQKLEREVSVSEFSIIMKKRVFNRTIPQCLI